MSTMAGRDEPPPSSRTGSSLGAACLTLLGIAFWLLLAASWPVTFDLTQGPDFSQEYLIQYGLVWDWFRPLLYQFEELFPTAATSLEALTTMLTIWWIVAFSLYLGALFVVHRSRPGRVLLALVLGFAVVFQAVLMLSPGILTTDLFSYAMYAYIARVYELNPYLYVPGYFSGNRLTTWIHPVWYYSPSIYGPVWLDLTWWLAGFTANRSLVDQALVYRLLANVANLANIGLLGLLLRRVGSRHLAAGLLLYAWNPLVLFEFAASGHNDVLMMTFVLLGFVFASYRRHLLAVAGVTLAALIKVTPVLVLPLLAVHVARRWKPHRDQFVSLCLSAAVAIAIAVGLYWPWYEGPQTFQLVEFWSRGPMYNNWTPDLIAHAIADRFLDPGLEDQERSWETARTAFKWLTRAIFLVYLAVELRRLASLRQVLAASARVFIAFLILVNTWVLPWYHTWAFILTVPLGLKSWVTRVALFLTLTAPCVMYNRHYWSENMPSWVYLVYLAPLALPLLDPCIRSELARLVRRTET